MKVCRFCDVIQQAAAAEKMLITAALDNKTECLMLPLVEMAGMCSCTGGQYS